MDSIRGIFSALITPMRADESVGYDMIKHLVERQIAQGCGRFLLLRVFW